MLSLKLIPGTVRRYRRTLTARRVWNAMQVVASYLLSRAFGRDVRMGRPFVLMVEPTNICNLRCPLCPSGNGTMTRHRGQMGYDGFRRLMAEQGPDLLLVMLWNQGEPFLHSRLTDMVRLAKAQNIITITSTNAHFIRTRQDAEDVVDSGLDEIVVSLDGATPETYVKYRVGGDFDRAVAGIGLLIQAKQDLGARKPLVHLQFIIMRHNEAEIGAARRLARELGVDRLSLKTSQVYTEAQADVYLPSQENLSRYRYGSPVLTTKSRITNTCRHLWYSSVINWDGTVVPCCFDKDGEYGFGNALNGQTFGEIWTGGAYEGFRNTILKDRTSVPMCSNCSEGLKGMFHDIEEIPRDRAI
jgi:MoaA/NifB/PqqE/SkfB family radical SAM enzyme